MQFKALAYSTFLRDLEYSSISLIFNFLFSNSSHVQMNIPILGALESIVSPMVSKTELEGIIITPKNKKIGKRGFNPFSRAHVCCSMLSQN